MKTEWQDATLDRFAEMTRKTRRVGPFLLEVDRYLAGGSPFWSATVSPVDGGFLSGGSGFDCPERAQSSCEWVLAEHLKEILTDLTGEK